MLKVCNIDIEHREEVYEKLRQFVRKLRKKFSIQEIYLFGSAARGELHEGSDLDVMSVGDFQGRIFKRIGEVLKITDLPIEPLVYTPQEFEKLKSGNAFIKSILKTGKRL
jgi:predicted nucleotidyltransferase